ncbi:cell envelope integrity protein TolA [Luteithermobacter gelatinilyticus]|uniref:cell envelope integrity protein TolA n=1 Tax=Luteithermobacter gelatinilyticus TaxID=2582913 RepID=UPI0011067B8B|nr:cell envelope integrity protein TolA [Luteithermobacter gelatinilyticus]
MRNALIISLVLHISVIAVAVVGLPSLRDDRAETEMTVIPVEVVRVADKTRLKPKPVKVDEAKDKPKEDAKKPERKTAPPPPEPPKLASSMPLPDMKPKPKPEKKKPEPKPQIARASTPNVTPRAKPRPPSRFSSSRIAALLDKRREEQKTLGEMLKEKGYYDQPQQISDLDLQQQTLSLADAIRRQVHNCWSIPAGAKNAEDLQVVIRINLTPDGKLARPPKVKDQDRMHQPGQEFFRTAAESALRAVRKCEPYELPRDKYELWREIELIFDPKEVLTG